MRSLFKILLIGANLVSASVIRPQTPLQDTVDHPSTPEQQPAFTIADEQLNSWISFFNAGDFDELEAHFRHKDPIPEGSPAAYQKYLQFTGGLQLVEVISNTGQCITALLVAKRQFICQQIKMDIDVQETDRPVTDGRIRLVHCPDAALRTFGQEKRPWGYVVIATSALLDEYLDPLKAMHMRAKIEMELSVGHYDRYDETHGQQFAYMLNNDLRHSGNDPRVKVVYQISTSDTSYLPPAVIRIQKQRPISSRHSLLTENFSSVLWKHLNYGLGSSHITVDGDHALGQKIAYLEIDTLISLSNTDIREAVAERVRKLMDADSLIIDLQNSQGDDEDYLAFILSFLLGPSQLLTESFNKYDQLVDSTWTMPMSELPEASKFWSNSKPIFIIISRTTENTPLQLAYHLKHFRGAVIIQQRHGNPPQKNANAALSEYQKLLSAMEDENKQRMWAAMDEQDNMAYKIEHGEPKSDEQKELDRPRPRWLKSYYSKTPIFSTQISKIPMNIADARDGEWFLELPQVRVVHPVTGSKHEDVGLEVDVVAGEVGWKDEWDPVKVAIAMATDMWEGGEGRVEISTGLPEVEQEPGKSDEISPADEKVEEVLEPWQSEL